MESVCGRSRLVLRWVLSINSKWQSAYNNASALWGDETSLLFSKFQNGSKFFLHDHFIGNGVQQFVVGTERHTDSRILYHTYIILTVANGDNVGRRYVILIGKFQKRVAFTKIVIAAALFRLKEIR